MDGGDAVVYVRKLRLQKLLLLPKSFPHNVTHTHTLAGAEARARTFWHRRHNTFALTQAHWLIVLRDFVVDDNRRRNNMRFGQFSFLCRNWKTNFIRLKSKIVLFFS